MSFAEALRRLREQVGMTQARLAEKAGVRLRTVQGWEQGYRRPVSPDFFRLVKGARGVRRRLRRGNPGGRVAPGARKNRRPRKAPADTPPASKKPRGRPRKGT